MFKGSIQKNIVCSFLNNSTQLKVNYASLKKKNIGTINLNDANYSNTSITSCLIWIHAKIVAIT